jgi:hypothetical protein
LCAKQGSSSGAGVIKTTRIAVTARTVNTDLASSCVLLSPPNLSLGSGIQVLSVADAYAYAVNLALCEISFVHAFPPSLLHPALLGRLQVIY